jgi:hypothetical protein
MNVKAGIMKVLSQAAAFDILSKKADAATAAAVFVQTRYKTTFCPEG